MKKIKSILIAILMFQIHFLVAQEVNVNWSDKQNENETKGILSNYLDANNENVFALFDKLDQGKKFENMKIVAFDKSTMKNKAEIEFIDLFNDKKLSSKFELLKVAIKEDGVYVFITKVEKEIEGLYFVKLDNNLRKVLELKNILNKTISSELKRMVFAGKRTSYTVIDNKNEIYIGYENPKLNQNTIFNYGKFDFKEGIVNEKAVELPTKTDKKYYGLTSVYKLLEDGNILFKYSLDDTETKNPGILKSSKKQIMLSFLNTKKNQFTSLEIDSRDTEIFNNSNVDINYLSDENKIKIFGFYLDTTINRKNGPIKAISFIEINKNTLEKSEIKNSFINPQYFNDLNFPLSSLNIEKLYEKDNNIYAVITQNFREILPGDASAIYYLKKGNIFVMKINDKGENSWVSKIEREKFFNCLFFIPDIKSYMLNDKIVVYFMTKPLSKKINLNPKHEDFQNNLNYSFVDIKTSQIENKEIYFNENKDSDDKMIHIQYSMLINDIFYTYPKIQTFTNSYTFGSVILK
jgi:hypothetical protein